MKSNSIKPRRKDKISSFRLPAETHDQLREISALDHRPVSYLVRLAVEQYLNRRRAAMKCAS